MNLQIKVTINDTDRLLLPDADVIPIINLLLLELFFKQKQEQALLRSEKMILYFLLKQIAFQCIVISADQLSVFATTAKRHSLSFHTMEHPDDKYLCLFFKDTDIYDVNEIIKNQGITVVENFGAIKSIDPDYERHVHVIRRFTDDESIFEVAALYEEYTEPEGLIEECKNYTKALLSSIVLGEMNQANAIKGIAFSDLYINVSDADILNFESSSELKGGCGTTDYFVKMENVRRCAVKKRSTGG